MHRCHHGPLQQIALIQCHAPVCYSGFMQFFEREYNPLYIILLSRTHVIYVVGGTGGYIGLLIEACFPAGLILFSE